jgi:hypothetical protein
MADPHHNHLRLRSARPLFRQTSFPYSSGEPVKHILAAESRAEMAKGRNAKVRLHCEQPACRRCRLISPSRVRQRGRLKYIKGAEARIRLDGFGEKRDGLVQLEDKSAAINGDFMLLPSEDRSHGDRRCAQAAVRQRTRRQFRCCRRPRIRQSDPPDRWAA